MFSTPGFRRPPREEHEVAGAGVRKMIGQDLSCTASPSDLPESEPRRMSAVVSPAPTAGSQARPPCAGELRLVAGDAESLEALYSSESRWLLRTLSRMTGNSEEARDLAHDAFLRLARLRADGSVLQRPRAYLRRIAANLVKDRAKSAARRSLALHVAADDEALPGADPYALLESRDMLRRLDAAMLRLRPKTREIFMAHRVHGLSYAEIAERTGLSVKGVEKQMSKALAQLDRLLNGR